MGPSHLCGLTSFPGDSGIQKSLRTNELVFLQRLLLVVYPILHTDFDAYKGSYTCFPSDSSMMLLGFCHSRFLVSPYKIEIPFRWQYFSLDSLTQSLQFQQYLSYVLTFSSPMNLFLTALMKGILSGISGRIYLCGLADHTL